MQVPGTGGGMEARLPTKAVLGLLAQGTEQGTQEGACPRTVATPEVERGGRAVVAVRSRLECSHPEVAV